jgi:hypothetical protein
VVALQNIKHLLCYSKPNASRKGGVTKCRNPNKTRRSCGIGALKSLSRGAGAATQQPGESTHWQNYRTRTRNHRGGERTVGGRHSPDTAPLQAMRFEAKRQRLPPLILSPRRRVRVMREPSACHERRVGRSASRRVNAGRDKEDARAGGIRSNA